MIVSRVLHAAVSTITEATTTGPASLLAGDRVHATSTNLRRCRIRLYEIKAPPPAARAGHAGPPTNPPPPARAGRRTAYPAQPPRSGIVLM